jgi:hypothetical protein
MYNYLIQNNLEIVFLLYNFALTNRIFFTHIFY